MFLCADCTLNVKQVMVYPLTVLNDTGDTVYTEMKQTTLHPTTIFNNRQWIADKRMNVLKTKQAKNNETKETSTFCPGAAGWSGWGTDEGEVCPCWLPIRPPVSFVSLTQTGKSFHLTTGWKAVCYPWRSDKHTLMCFSSFPTGWLLHQSPPNTASRHFASSSGKLSAGLR